MSELDSQLELLLVHRNLDMFSMSQDLIFPSQFLRLKYY